MSEPTELSAKDPPPVHCIGSAPTGSDPLEASLLSGTAAVFSQGIASCPHVIEFLGAKGLILRPRSARGIDYVVGWGHKPNTLKPRAFAEAHNLPFVRLEDGFLRSTVPGRSQPSASMVIDPLGIYYDASSPSRLEQLIANPSTDERHLQRAGRLVERIVRSELSKYNPPCPEGQTILASLPSEYVLVVDQIARDASVLLSAGSRSVFEQMVQSAISENPGVPVVVKSHPAARTGRQGALDGGRFKASEAMAALHWVTEPINPHALIARAQKVYVATSQVGFEALLHRKPVICFGQPFYAGWGLTDDRKSIARRTARVRLEQLAAAALLDYSRYVHPVSAERCEVEDIAEHFELQRSSFARNEGRTYCFGFWWWKRAHARRFLASERSELLFCWGRKDAERRGFDEGSRALAWGMRAGAPVESLCRENGVTLERMEDGFIRSVGLGSDLTAPWSLVVDRRGIYYDPRQPSDLEVLLGEHAFTEKQLADARRLREALLSSGISKYNPFATSNRQPASPSGAQRRILVPGQVEADESVLVGSPVVRSNLALLKAVRTHHPSAHIVFKPHPDVEAGNRPGRVSDEDALCYCDELVRDCPIAESLAAATELHTMTSLVGFEALMRQIPVEVYGQPFYAGWGLTRDHCPPLRRKRQLSLDELVAGTLLLYPRYVDPTSGYFCSAEHAVARISAQRANAKAGNEHWLRLPLSRPMVHTYQFLRGMVLETLGV